MEIRDYKESDEKAWLYCRVVSFLDCSYYNDVKTKKDIYEHPSICLVAEEDDRIIGFIDVEIDSKDLTCNKGERGAVIWHLGVLPEYRQMKVAKQLWLSVKQRLLQLNIHYCEVWTQQDVPANQFYVSNGFVLNEEQTWLRCYISGEEGMKLLKEDLVNDMYGPEEMIIDVPKEQRDKWIDRSYRADEVRLYSTTF
ncbi:MAG: GNAT family N-acetyltransferase [Clostridia bacterium]|nr:GNAT family N-acetyltransferase [Clostridia bacterium]